MEGKLSNFSEPIALLKADETKWETYWDKLVDRYHYLGYVWQFGCRIKYLIAMGCRIIGAIGFCSGVYRLAARDKFIGMDENTRDSMLPHVINNNRFLILPFVSISNLASHILSISLKRVVVDWKEQYDVEPYLVETFVDCEKYRGVSYKAANWTCLGKTQGFGKQGGGFVYHGKPKEIYVRVLNRSFARKCTSNLGQSPCEREELVAMINGIPMWTPSLIWRMGLPEVVAGGAETFAESLADHISRYLPFLGRKGQKEYFVTQIKGHLSDLERKSNEPMALAFAGADGVRNLAYFMSEATWDNEGMLGEYRKETSERLFEPEGMITGDGCDFPKKGNNSVGVQRQYCGRLGKTDNCQASVMVGYAGAKGYGLLDYRLYMPERWFNEAHEKLRKQNFVPEDLVFKTKNQMMSEMISNVIQSGQFQGKYVGVDSSFGSDKSFLDSLPEGLIYFADIHNNDLVFKGRPELVTAPYSGRGRRPVAKPEFPPVRVDSIAEDESVPWNDIVLGIGAKGPIIAEDKLLRVTEVRDGYPGNDVWLYIRRLEDKSLKYALCNAPADSPPESVRKPALMRWAIEQCFKECKKYLGLGHYELRSWPGWHRHILITLIAHLFVIKLRQKFSVCPRSPGSTPYIERPVSLDEYLDAYKKMEMDEAIDHPDIKPFSKDPQQLMTIGLVLKLISPFIIKLGAVLEEIDYNLKNSADAFASHSKSTLEALCKSRGSRAVTSG